MEGGKVQDWRLRRQKPGWMGLQTGEERRNRTAVITQSLRLLRELKQLNLAEQFTDGQDIDQDIDQDINTMEDKILAALEGISLEDAAGARRRRRRRGKKGGQEEAQGVGQQGDLASGNTGPSGNLGLD